MLKKNLIFGLLLMMLFVMSTLFADALNPIQEENQIYLEEQTNVGNEVNATEIIQFSNDPDSKDNSLYVSAPSSLIKDEEKQTYSVIIDYVVDLYAFTVQIKFLKADFAEPTVFTLGSAYTGSGNTPFFECVYDSTDGTNYIYTVTGGFLGAVNGLTDTDLTLFTVDLTSAIGANNISGSHVSLPQGVVVLRDHLNTNIACSGTTDKVITIDSVDPTMVTLTEPGNETLAIDRGKTITNGWASVVDTDLGLSFSDNYNLDYVQYLIQLQSTADPADTVDFSENVQTGISGTLWNNSGSDWQIPDNVLNAAVNNLPTGNYDIFFLAVDDAGNFDIWNWKFKIDKDAPGVVTWGGADFCHPTVDANKSIALQWTKPLSDVENIHIWVKDFASFTNFNAYPGYNPSSDGEPTIGDLTPIAFRYDVDGSYDSWTRIKDDENISSYNHDTSLLGISGRGYFYYVIFVEDEIGNMSAPSVVKASVSYWPGDIDGLGDVNGFVLANDISALSAVWSTDGLLNRACDVGPTTDNGRHSRPTPDENIDIEDLMIFAMNYENTNYSSYSKDEIPASHPIYIDLVTSTVGDQLIAELVLDYNDGFVRGLHIPINYGSGLVLNSVTSGDIWNCTGFFIYANKGNCLEVDGSALGELGIIENNGTIATLTFDIVGDNIDFLPGVAIARSVDNEEIECTGFALDADDEPIPTVYNLYQNYPNPFNKSTKIMFALPQAGKVKITVYNIRGQLVDELTNEDFNAGNHVVEWNNPDLKPGMYFYRIKTDNYTKVKKCLLIR